MKRFIFLLLIILTPKAFADTYVSPESYAVNEADFLDYRMIAPPKPLDVDSLDDDRFQAPNLVEKDFYVGNNEESGQKTEQVDEKYKKRLSYKFAKWWVDQRYKREEPHHGALHEIKVDKRIEYEKREQAKLLEKNSQN